MRCYSSLFLLFTGTLTMLLRSSFGGRSCTSVVVNVAGDAVHSNETVASLRFGARMAQVSNNATVVVGQDSRSVMADTEAALAAARRELAAMDRAGAGPRFGEDAVPSEIRSVYTGLPAAKLRIPTLLLEYTTSCY